MFLAHTNDLTQGNYKPLAQFNKKKALVNNAGEISLESNVCPHQLSLLSFKEGTGNRVCPYHNWSFDITGAPITSGRTGHYCKNLNSLNRFDLFSMNGLLFDTQVICKELNWLDLSKMQLKEQRVDRVTANSKIIMDVFLDVDHIQSVHAGVYDLIGLPKIDQVQWHYYDWGSLQLVANGDDYGAAWLAVYPGTMIEWQPGALFVTVATSVNQSETDVHVFKYSDNEEDWRLNDSVWELAWSQDQMQAELITGFTNNNLEESKKHFRQWLTK
jgi:phenylpropionate dioxygenase-like ring-hydroxylating dioxygenase large terminal subunit